MIFRILGPLRVEDGQGTRPLAAPKQRVILASLLLRPNQVVPVAELLDRLWGKHHPASATATLYNHVARLRRSLGDEAGAPILTRAPGYLMEIRHDGELDLGRFHALRAAAASVAQDGDHDRAAALLGQALGLWRGNALSDVPAGTLPCPDTEQLDELRLAARRQRIEYELASGAGEALLPELRQLLAADPYQENLYGQLMRALYRSGRQADALEVFRAARATLLDESPAAAPCARQIESLRVRTRRTERCSRPTPQGRAGRDHRPGKRGCPAWSWSVRIRRCQLPCTSRM